MMVTHPRREKPLATTELANPAVLLTRWRHKAFPYCQRLMVLSLLGQKLSTLELGFAFPSEHVFHHLLLLNELSLGGILIEFSVSLCFKNWEDPEERLPIGFLCLIWLRNIWLQKREYCCSCIVFLCEEITWMLTAEETGHTCLIWTAIKRNLQ